MPSAVVAIKAFTSLRCNAASASSRRSESVPPVYGSTSEVDRFDLLDNGLGAFEFALTFSDWRLLPGAYRLRAHALDPEGMRLYDTVERDFTVLGDSREQGLVRLPHRWHDPQK